MVIDAKSTASGRVSENQINWLTIDQHRKQESAELACVIGPGFAGGALTQRAEDLSVCLMTTEELAELVRLHAEKPVTLIELKHAFAASPHASDGLHNVRSAANERARRMYLLMFLLRKVDEFNRESPDELMVKPDVLWGAAAGDPDVKGATRSDVANALHLLEALGILAEADGGAYRPQTSLAGALQIVGAYGRLSNTAEDEPGEQSGESEMGLAS